MNILEALDDPNLLGAAIRDPESWRPWRAFLAAAFGLGMDDNTAAELFRACTGRAGLPTAPFQFLWLVCGRRGGKSFCMATMAVFLACFRDWRRYLSPGERAVVLLVASDREQARFSSGTFKAYWPRHCWRLWLRIPRRIALICVVRLLLRS